MQYSGKPAIPLQLRQDQPEGQGNQDRGEAQDCEEFPWLQPVRKQSVEQEERNAVQQRVQKRQVNEVAGEQAPWFLRHQRAPVLEEFRGQEKLRRQHGDDDRVQAGRGR